MVKQDRQRESRSFLDHFATSLSTSDHDILPLDGFPFCCFSLRADLMTSISILQTNLPAKRTSYSDPSRDILITRRERNRTSFPESFLLVRLEFFT
jgi:hypothetical protein